MRSSFMPQLSAKPSRIDATRLAINAAWLAQLRWVAVAGQLATIAAVNWGLGVDAPAWPLMALVAVTAVTNAGFAAWVRSRRAKPQDALRPRVWHMVLGGFMLLDLLVLSAMLSLTGGPTNPFVVFYFVNLALCGVLLPVRWAWLLCAMAVVAFAAISYQHLPLAVLQNPDRLQSFVELQSMPVAGIGALAAFAACSVVIVLFATRLTSELRSAQEARRQAEELRARSEKLEALGTLAAGAAHELATPLGAIAVAAGELQHDLSDASSDAQDELRVIREGLARCRRILDRMSMDSGQAAGEALVDISVDELVDEVLGELSEGQQVKVVYERGAGGDAGELPLSVPKTALSQALRALVQNGLDAAAGRGVSLSAQLAADGANVVIVVADRGPGMPAEVLARAGEPFYTTKEPGRGMGLGLYLARSVVERLGGKLEIRSQAGTGTVVSVTLRLGGQR